MGVVDRVSVFSGDDVTTSWQGRTLPLPELLLTPIDVHTVPLHRAVTFVLAQLSPLNDHVALGAMFAIHALSVWLLYRALESIRHSATNVFVVACYATFVHLGSLFSWWVAAVHRLPYLCCLGGALWAYSVFRRRLTLRLAVLIVATLVAGLGFFEKAVFIPLVLLCVEASLIVATPDERPRWRPLAALHGVLLALTVTFLVVWSHTVNRRMMGSFVTDFAYLAEYLRLSWSTLIGAVAGQIDGGPWLGAFALTAIVVVTCTVRPGNAVVFVLAGALVSASLLVTALSSARMNLWGLFWTRCWRYYPDVMYVLAIFTGIALSQAARAPVLVRLSASRYRMVPGLVAAAALILLARTSFVHGARAVLGDSNTTRSRVYLDNVRAGIQRLQDEHEPLVFVDGMVPNYLQYFQDGRARHRVLLRALGAEVQMTRPRHGAYRIDPDGNVVAIR
jgi:uncharacterized membrane protein